MKNEWKRTSFRIRKIDHERLKSMSDRAGYKIKDFLDELIKTQVASGIWEKNQSEGVSDVYKECLELKNSKRVTFEVSSSGLNRLNEVQQNHSDINRDQILSIMIFSSDSMFAFPLRLERARLKKIRPLIKRVVGLRKTIEIRLKKSFKDDHILYLILGWNDFLKSVERLDQASEKWSRDLISPSVANSERRNL